MPDNNETEHLGAIISVDGYQMSYRNVATTLSLLVNPPSYIVHMRDVVHLTHGEPLRTLSIDFMVPQVTIDNETTFQSDDADGFLFPVLAVPLGNGPNLPAALRDGSHVPLLSTRSARAAESILLSAVFATEWNRDPNHLVAGCKRLIGKLRREMRDRNSAHANNPAVVLELSDNSLISAIHEVFGSDDGIRGSLSSNIFQMLKFFSICEIQFIHESFEGQRLRTLTIETRVERVALTHGFRTKVRTFFGFRPFVLRCETPGVMYARSYSFQLEAPDSHFVRFQGWVLEDIYELQSETRVTSLSYGSESNHDVLPHGRPRKVGQLVSLNPRPREEDGDEPFSKPSTSVSPVAYLRWSDETEGLAPPWAFVVFNEKPPGTILRAALYSTLCLVLLLAGALVFRELLTVRSVNVEAAILLFTLPGSLALWLRPGHPQIQLIDPPLISVVALAAVGFTSFFAGIAFLISNAATTSACSWPLRCTNSGGVLRRDGSKQNWWEPHLHFLGVNINAVGILYALSAFVVCVVILLMWRAMTGVKNFSRAQGRQEPKPLPKQLLETGR
jgi:hypothetical protein